MFELLQVTVRPASTLLDASRVTAVACEVAPTATEVGASEALTLATGTAVTVSPPVPLRPSLVAVIVALPTASAVTRPLLFTVATDVFELLHAIARPVSTVFTASRVTAVACVVPPTVTDVAANDTVTVATGAAVTASTAVPLRPSLVAVMVAVPTVSEVTSPAPLTMATAGLELAHATGRPVRTLLAASRAVAVACVVPPTVTDVAASDTLTVATGTADTVNTALPLRPSLVPAMSEVPTESAVTSPVLLTVATAVFELLHTTDRPLSTLLAASVVTAVACVVPPTVTDGTARLTLTAATGTAVTASRALPLLPSLAAEMMVAPTVSAVTRPAADTVATAGFELVHTIVRPVSTLFAASRAVAVAWVVPRTMMDVSVRATPTVAIGTGTTVTTAVPTTPSTVALITALPGAMARTRPVLETMAAVLFPERHSTARPVSTPPALSRTVTARSPVSPAMIETLAGDTSTRITAGDRTVMVAVANRPSDAANTRPVPGARPTTVPSGAAMKTLGAPEVHVTGRCDSVPPPASSTAAVSRAAAPTISVVLAGEMRTDATGEGDTTTVAVPTCPSLVTVIVAAPGAFAVTVPSLSTCATVALLLRKVAGRPVNRVPLASVICTIRRTV